MAQYSREEIERILQISYYDRRTDYVWKHLMGDAPELENILYPIPSMESFQVMHNMLRKRTDSVEEFLKDWQQTSHPGLLDCQYSKRSGILCVKARSFVLTYRTKLNEFHFIAYAKIAKSIGLKDRSTQKKYRKSGIFSLSYLVELDEQLYSRYAEKEKVKAWRKTPQFELDCQYCKAMIPVIMQDAETKIRLLGSSKQLNIILHGNDTVRIGIVRDYSPEEMISMPCYPREQWQEGISVAFASLEKEYTEELEEHTIEMQQWSDELSKIVVGKSQFCIEGQHLKFISDHLEDTYSKIVLAAALGTEDELSATLNKKVNQIQIPRNVKLTKMMKELYDSVQEERLQEYHAALERKNSPQHTLLVEEIKYIIQQSAPLIAYTGPYERIRNNYNMNLYVVENDRVKVTVSFLAGNETGIFDLDSYQSEFRLWWSQQLLKECKFAKQCALHPEDNWPFEVDLPF